MQRKNLTTKFKAALILCVLVLAAAVGYWFGMFRNDNQFAVARAASEEARGDKSSYETTFFSDFLTWPSSASPKESDNTRKFLHMIYGAGNIPFAPFHFIDMNGDGLVDILYSTGYSQIYYGIFLNDGANSVEPVYIAPDKNQVTWYTDFS